MALKNANSLSGVWLGLILVLVVHTLAENTPSEEETEAESSHINYDSQSNDDFRFSKEDFDNYFEKDVNQPNIEDISEAAGGLGNESLENADGVDATTTAKTVSNFTTLRHNETIPTIATIDFENNLTITDNEKTAVEGVREVSRVESSQAQSNATTDKVIVEVSKEELDSGGEGQSESAHREFEFAEEHDDFDEHTSSEFDEATTPSSALLNASSLRLPDNLHKHVEQFDIENSDEDEEADGNDTHSLMNDTNVNYRLDFKYGTKRFPENDTRKPNGDNGEGLTSEPKHEVEIFKNVTYPSVLRISEDPNNATVIDDTTPNYSSSKPKARTISISGDNDVSTKNSKNFNHTRPDQAASDTIMRISPKKSVPTEKPTKLKPYPYLTSESTSINYELVTDLPNKTEVSTEEIAAYKNTIDRQKSDDKIIVTEPSVLVDNSIEKFKPVHEKRSGTLPRVNSTLGTSAAATAWSAPTTENSMLKNATDVTEEAQTTVSQSRHRNQTGNDVPQSNMNISVTTEEPSTILSEVTENNIENVIGKVNGTNNPTVSTPITKKLIDHHEATKNNSELVGSEVLNFTEKIETVTSGSSTSNEIQTITEKSKITPIQRIDDVPSSTETYPVNATNDADKSKSKDGITASLPMFTFTTTKIVQESSSEIPVFESNGTRPIEENVANVSHPRTISQSYGSTKDIAESKDDQTTTIQYKFVSLTDGEKTTTPFPSDDVSPESVTVTNSLNETSKTMEPPSSEENSTFTNLFNNISVTTVSQETTESVVTDDSTDENPTSLSTMIETVKPDNVNSSTTIVFPDTTTSNTKFDVTTTEDLPNTTNSPVSETGFTTGTKANTDATISPTFGANTFNGRIEETTTAQNENPEETTTTMMPVTVTVIEETTTASNSEVIVSTESTSTSEIPTTVTLITTLIPETGQQFPNSSNNAIAVVAVSSVALICLVLLAGLLFIMRKRQTRFNNVQRCRPLTLEAYRVGGVSAYNSMRRKDRTRDSKRSYGNPAFEDSSVTPSHPLNFAGLSSFCNDLNAINEEFAGIPQVSARIDELPAGAEVKNRYANVVPLPETRVPLQKINNEPLTEYINASYVRGPKNATKYYIACQAPIESTVADFWRMIWEQQSKVIIMLTDIVENGVEKCVDYIPPSEVTDCHRLYGDYQVTLKKHEAKEKYAISTLHLKNLENNTYREVSHIWYLWPTNGVPSDATGLIAILLEARALQRGAPGPIVVHCSPGTGRTGTLIALDLGIRQYEITRTVDVPRVVYTIRRDRAGAVQTKEQYAFIYKGLNLYAAKLAGGALESM
ncbi:receptor-type tyrosine-protein phosphatase zeta-like isoform X1 [Neodiprion virginianus]|uniref:receptor-type tyrosine-protein phosphatase zeta-like isoform X1 n=1 Tax=Neodiprion virginianus TaxID=2961670 RepID=UPI001EE6CD17|nr:receptor-type tyrosine-protein phosphatase zeta-like isoform X1 [Neodiprion virginianus]XP_046625430.1 receptor-type tyrosine-protein phosphatase zeta-like isoform X1 [Neodiprion virginianus]XP_046625431.1 receptor-type tyrosine-protein phosphatase zeta-like isoform X1 [Neodiprion virginianus]